MVCKRRHDFRNPLPWIHRLGFISCRKTNPSDEQGKGVGSPPPPPIGFFLTLLQEGMFSAPMFFISCTLSLAYILAQFGQNWFYGR